MYNSLAKYTGTLQDLARQAICALPILLATEPSVLNVSAPIIIKSAVFINSNTEASDIKVTSTPISVKTFTAFLDSLKGRDSVHINLKFTPLFLAALNIPISVEL